MSTIDTSTWNPDADLNTAIEGIPLNSHASIAQTWQVIRILMAAFKGDTSAIQALMVPFSGATASADGGSGFVPAPEAGDQDKVLKGDGTWGTLSASNIPNLDASKIASGTIDIARLPAGALERLVTVADQTARYALTAADVQLGDTVKQADTGLLYFVVDTAKLNSTDGYEVYTAGAATAVAWSGITDKPSTFTPSSHTHGSITNDGKVGTASGKPLVTGSGGAVTAGSFGTTAGTFCEGSDSRLSNARTPTSHTHGSITNDGKLGTASRAVVTDGNKAIVVSSVTATELGYLSGVTSGVQTQLTDLGTEDGYLADEILLVKGIAANGAAIAVANQLFVKEVEDGLALKVDGTHVHGNVTNDGKIGSAAGRPIITGTNGLLQAGAMIADAQIDALFD